MPTTAGSRCRATSAIRRRSTARSSVARRWSTPVSAPWCGLSNDVSPLAAGEGCPALLLTVQGRVTADLRLAALVDEMLLDCDLRVRDGVVAALEALLIADDVELAVPANPPALIGVEGPDAARVLGGVSALAPFAHTELAIAGTGVRVQRANEVRGDGFVLHVPAAQAAAVWDALVTAGASPCGM